MSFDLDRLANQLDWNLLCTLMVIVQERSITGAAKRLNVVTQPSVRAALRRLEERLEAQLIERGSGRAFVITSAGERVYREALEICGGVVRLNELGGQNEETLSGNIVVYRSSHLELGFLSVQIDKFRLQHPAVTFAIITAPCADVVRSVRHRVRHDIGDAMTISTSSIVDLIGLMRNTRSIGCITIAHAHQFAPDLWQIPISFSPPMVDIYGLLDIERPFTPAERIFVNILADQNVLER